MPGEKDYLLFVGLPSLTCEIEAEWNLPMGIHLKWLVGVKVIIINYNNLQLYEL